MLWTPYKTIQKCPDYYQGVLIFQVIYIMHGCHLVPQYKKTGFALSFLSWSLKVGAVKLDRLNN